MSEMICSRFMNSTCIEDEKNSTRGHEMCRSVVGNSLQVATAAAEYCHVPVELSCFGEEGNHLVMMDRATGAAETKKRKTFKDHSGVQIGEDSTREKRQKRDPEHVQISEPGVPKRDIHQTNDNKNNSTNSSINSNNEQSINCSVGRKSSSKASTPRTDFIHVRARRGEATDSHSLAERVRREKISERMKYLQDLVPGCNKISGKAGMLDEIINYVQSLQRQVEFLSMKLATLNPLPGFNTNSCGKEILSATSNIIPREAMPSEIANQCLLQFSPLLHLISSTCHGTIPELAVSTVNNNVFSEPLIFLTATPSTDNVMVTYMVWINKDGRLPSHFTYLKAAKMVACKAFSGSRHGEGLRR